ncbi:MAG: pirin family protein [Gammaproteobacteria bacterium]|jgi:quercetin 2,3-dioxygenase
MMTIRRASERGHFENSWLNANHSFSFGEYYDPANMGYSNLRVLNDDTIAPKGGFPTHPHDNMEIVTYVLSGALEHKDSMGNGSVIRAGDVQRMSAGTGIRHSEFNPSQDEPVKLLQIWLRPNRLGVEPEYSQEHFPAEQKRGRLRLIVSPDGRDGSIATYQDSLLYASIVEYGQEIHYTPSDDRVVYLHVAQGSLSVNGERLERGDSILTTNAIGISTRNEGEFLLFDMPA